jgi:hypothetical protein
VQISPLFWAFALFCPQFSHPPETRPYGRVSGVGWPPVHTESRVLDIGWTPEFRRKSRVSGVGCPSGAIAWSKDLRLAFWRGGSNLSSIWTQKWRNGYNGSNLKVIQCRVLHPSKIEVGWVGVRCHPTQLFKQSGVGWTPDTRPYFGRVSGTGRVDAYCPVNYP